MCKGAKSQSDTSNRAIPLEKHISTYTTKYELSQYLNLGEQMYKCSIKIYRYFLLS